MNEKDGEMSARTRPGSLLMMVTMLVLTPVLVLAQQPTSREYPYIFKSTRAMGMGGAYTAVGGRVDSLFYNPAGLINIPRDKGWEVNGFPLLVPLNISAEYGKNTMNFVDDITDAIDTDDLNGDGDEDDDQLRAVNDVLTKYRGSNLHARLAVFPSLGKSYDRFAFGIGGIGSVRIDAVAHQGFGADGLLEVNADALYGGIGGVSFGVTENVFAGISLKYLRRESLIHDFTARELVEKQDTLDDFIMDELRTSGEAAGADAGVLWKFAQDSALRPSFGASVLNIGGLHFGRAGSIPMSVNTGFAINPSISWSRSLIVGVDYIDVLNNYKQDKDMEKRLRYGAELQLFDIWPVEMALRAGMYEGSPTLGADFRLLFLNLSYAMYTEQVGAFAGQDKDKRQLVSLNIGW
jgi:hypothetical protein